MSSTPEALPGAWARIAELSGCATRRKAAEAVIPILSGLFGAQRVLVYLVADAVSRPFFRAAACQAQAHDPAFCDEFELLRFARQNALEVLRLSLPREAVGIVLLDRVEEDPSWVTPLALAISLAFSAVWAREQSSRGAMRDSSSSVYTLAYFVDVASRCLEVARSHDRHFAVAMVLIEPSLDAGIEAANHLQLAAASTDVVARADSNEFYVLFPETDGVEAFFARQRLIERMPGELSYQTSLGVACFPHDGTDVSRLMQRAKLRADAFVRSANHYFGMAELSLPVLTETLLALGQSRAEARYFAESLRYLDLSLAEARTLVVQCTREAARAGATRVFVVQHGALELSGLLRAEAKRELEDVSLQPLDISALPDSFGLEAWVILAQHAVYAAIGRVEKGRFRGVHAADPCLADLLIHRLQASAGSKLRSQRRDSGAGA